MTVFAPQLAQLQINRMHEQACRDRLFRELRRIRRETAAAKRHAR